MSPFLIALLVGLLVGGALTFLLRGKPAAPVAPSRDHTQLAKLSWGAFVRLVLQAMQGRGWRAVVEPGMPADGIPEEGGDLLLAKGDKRLLLECRYGTGSVVGADAVLGLSKSASLRGATEVLLVTPGRFDAEAVRIAQQQRIDLLDGETLWPEVRPYVTLPKHEAPASAPAPAAPRRPLLLAWGAAALAGGVAWMIAQGMQPPPYPPASIAQTPQAATTQAAPAAAAPATATPAPPPPVDAIPPDPGELALRRAVAADAVATLAQVERAEWASQSTLVIHLAAEDADPGKALCDVLERYPELAASRLQLQAPPGSQRPVLVSAVPGVLSRPTASHPNRRSRPGGDAFRRKAVAAKAAPTDARWSATNAPRASAPRRRSAPGSVPLPSAPACRPWPRPNRGTARTRCS